MYTICILYIYINITLNQVILRARLSVKYEEKEAARRHVLWRSRDIYTADQMPNPELRLVNPRE
jgi:hypothetical protein